MAKEVKNFGKAALLTFRHCVVFETTPPSSSENFSTFYGVSEAVSCNLEVWETKFLNFIF